MSISTFEARDDSWDIHKRCLEDAFVDHKQLLIALRETVFHVTLRYPSSTPYVAVELPSIFMSLSVKTLSFLDSVS